MYTTQVAAQKKYLEKNLLNFFTDLHLKKKLIETIDFNLRFMIIVAGIMNGIVQNGWEISLEQQMSSKKDLILEIAIVIIVMRSIPTLIS